MSSGGPSSVYAALLARQKKQHLKWPHQMERLLNISKQLAQLDGKTVAVEVDVPTNQVPVQEVPVKDKEVAVNVPTNQVPAQEVPVQKGLVKDKEEEDEEEDEEEEAPQQVLDELETKVRGAVLTSRVLYLTGQLILGGHLMCNSHVGYNCVFPINVSVKASMDKKGEERKVTGVYITLNILSAAFPDLNEDAILDEFRELNVQRNPGCSSSHVSFLENYYSAPSLLNQTNLYYACVMADVFQRWMKVVATVPVQECISSPLKLQDAVNAITEKRRLILTKNLETKNSDSRSKKKNKSKTKTKSIVAIEEGKYGMPCWISFASVMSLRFAWPCMKLLFEHVPNNGNIMEALKLWDTREVTFGWKLSTEFKITHDEALNLFGQQHKKKRKENKKEEGTKKKVNDAEKTQQKKPKLLPSSAPLEETLSFEITLD